MRRKKIVMIVIVFNIILNIALFIGVGHTKTVLNGNKVNTSFTVEEDIVEQEVNDLYGGEKVSILVNGKELEAKANVSYVKMNLLNEYYVLYEAKVNEYRTEEYYKKIKVVDKTEPRISFKGTEVMYLSLNEAYKEPGYEAIDNYDGDITDTVKRTGKVDSKKEGTYLLTYKVSDSSGNTSERSRKVIVKKEIVPSKKEEPEDINKNAITSLTLTSEGFIIEGSALKEASKYEIVLDGKNTKTYEVKSTVGHLYKGDISLENIPNGNYTVYLKDKKKEKLPVEIKDTDRPVRFKVGNKLITFSYKDNELGLKVEKFKYEYDILIDPGHGGSDTGTIGNGKVEKDINLEQSLYEKKRFEEHGYKVKMTREDDSYGEMLGDASWQAITRRAYTIGYYGVVSKFSYSNHHNSIDDPNYMGWEVLVPASLSYGDLSLEHAIIEQWNTLYPLTENHTRMYARNYETGAIYNKINGQTYSFKDYYAVNRMPLTLFDVKAVIFEGAYLSNASDLDWYYTKQNYKKLSEVKIKTYVEALGGTYQKPE